MDMGAALDLGRQAMVVALLASLPILSIGLAVGLVISIFQSVTQMHEQTLAFIPKIAAMMVAAAYFIPWIAHQMLDYTREMLGSLP